MTLRAVDHLVLPTASLATARTRLQALGFTVAPEGLHPFGTKNVCVYLADDTFIEALATADEGLADNAISAGNVFVARDRVFRRNKGEEGFSAVVIATGNADADHSAFLAAGISAGARLDFSRPYVDANGASKTVSFRLAFAAPPGVADTYFFTCERIDAPTGGRGALAIHANGAKSLSRIVACARDPRALASFMALLAGKQPQVDGMNLTVPTANAAISILSPGQLTQEFGIGAALPDDDLALCGIVYTVDSLATAAAACEAGGVRYARVGDRLVIPHAPGQGAFFAFEETSSS